MKSLRIETFIFHPLDSHTFENCDAAGFKFSLCGGVISGTVTLHKHFVNELAGAYLADGQAKKAIDLLEHVARVRETTLDEGHPDRLASFNSTSYTKAKKKKDKAKENRAGGKPAIATLESTFIGELQCLVAIHRIFIS